MDRAGTAADVPAVAACLASAFHDDPVWGLWTFPDEGRRRRELPAFMTLMAELGLGEVWTDMTAGAESVTMWTPPGASYGTPQQQRRMSAALERLLGAQAAKIEALFDQFDAHVPAGRHYHLEWWATHRDHAGRGLGSALLRENLARVDAERLPAYLESTNPANLPRYEALGFARLHEFAPPDGPSITTMWRPAR